MALIKDRDTGQSEGFAFIEMSNQSEAEKAIQMFNDYTLANRPFKVNLARPKEKRSFGGGGYGDKPGGPGGGYGRGGPGVVRVVVDPVLRRSTQILNKYKPAGTLREFFYQPNKTVLAGAPSDPLNFSGRQYRSYTPGDTWLKSKPSRMTIPGVSNALCVRMLCLYGAMER